MKSSTEELLAFVAVVDSGSITAAAEQLGLTTSGVSRSLSRLEEKLETTLLNRTTRRLDLTEEGRLFLQHARGILLAIDEAEELMALHRERPAGRLRINAASPFMLHVIVPLVEEFHRLYPDIELELNTSDRIIDLLEQRTDIALRFGALQDSSLHARRLGEYRIRIVASPRYLERYGTPKTMQDLDKHRLIGFTQPTSLNIWPLRNAEPIKATFSASSGETVRQLVLNDLGIASLSDFMAKPDCESGAMVRVLEEETLEVWQPIHAVYYRNTQLSARIRCFVDFLAANMP